MYKNLTYLHEKYMRREAYIDAQNTNLPKMDTYRNSST